MIDLIVGGAVLLFGIYLVCWLASSPLRERIERPKHVFLQQVRDRDAESGLDQGGDGR